KTNPTFTNLKFVKTNPSRNPTRPSASGARRRARFRASVRRAHYRVAALAARFARQRGAGRRSAMAILHSRFVQTNPTHALRRDMVGADDVAPKLDLAVKQCTRGLGRFLFRRKRVHAALGKGLLRLGIGERGVQRTVELVDDRARRAGGREQHVPEID